MRIEEKTVQDHRVTGSDHLAGAVWEQGFRLRLLGTLSKPYLDQQSPGLKTAAQLAGKGARLPSW